MGVRLLSRYVNHSTFSMVSPSISMFGSLLHASNYRIIIHRLRFTSNNIDGESVFLAASFNILSEFSSSFLVSSRRSTKTKSSVSRRLMIRIIVYCDSALSFLVFVHCSFKVCYEHCRTVGDVGTPCLVPLIRNRFLYYNNVNGQAVAYTIQPNVSFKGRS